LSEEPSRALPTEAERESFRERGWLWLPDALEAEELSRFQEACQRVLGRPHLSHEPGAGSLHAILESVWIEWRETRFHAWALAAAEALMGRPLDYWYHQLLFKAPLEGPPTHWHQDDAYLGVEEDLTISCWLAVQDVGPDAACMEFLSGGQRAGLLAELAPEGEPGGTPPEPPGLLPEQVHAQPLRAGSVTFHHGKTPHRTGPNLSPAWRLAFIQRFALRGVPRPGPEACRASSQAPSAAGG